MYELVILWANGMHAVYEYATKKDAERAERNMKMANGDQIDWSGVRMKYRQERYYPSYN